MSKKGLRFFGTDYNALQFGGTITSSSADNTNEFAFDGLVGTKWITDGEDTDGDQVTLEMDYGFNRTIDAFYLYDTNIEDIEVQWWTGSAWETASPSVATITKSADEMFVFIKMDTAITTGKVRIVGENTLVPDQEKYITQFMAFEEIGQFNYFPFFSPKFTPAQNRFKTTDGRDYVIERGESFSADIQFKSHVNQEDIDLAEGLLVRREPFFIWPNGGDDSIFRYSFRPFRFRDIFKVTVVGDNSPEFTKNYYKAGYNNTMKITEVV